MGAADNEAQVQQAPPVDTSTEVTASPEEENVTLKQQIAQLQSEVNALTIENSTLKGDETAETTPPVPVETEHLKTLKQELVQEEEKLVQDQKVVREDQEAISNKKNEIAAEEANPTK